MLRTPSLYNFFKFRQKMEAVVTYLTKTLTPQLPATQMSTLAPKMTTGQDILKMVVDEFIGCRGVQWEASLDLTTEDGKVALAFSTTLGHPSTTLKPSPATSPNAQAREPAYSGLLAPETPAP